VEARKMYKVGVMQAEGAERFALLGGLYTVAKQSTQNFVKVQFQQQVKFRLHIRAPAAGLG